jgi:phage terminase large subunit-like protein
MGGLRLEVENPGDRAVRFINNLTLSDDFQGAPFCLRPWQAAIPRQLFGTLTPEGLRRYRRCFIFLPRKQAKTQLSAAIALTVVLGLGLKGQTVLLAASDRGQASHLFEKAAEMIEASPYLSRRCRILYSLKRIETREGRNVLKVISADGRRQLGQNPSVVILDELLTQPDRKLHDSLATSFGTRREPLMILISTAGNDRGTLVHEEYTYACSVRDGKVIDPTYLPVIYEALPTDDWTSEETWAKAMPALGDFGDLAFFRSEFARAKADPAQEAIFKQFYLNLWVSAATKWLNREGWDLCGTAKFDPASLLGKRCFGGLDLSNKSDLSAFVLVFPMGDGSYRVLFWGWIPEEYARKHDGRGGNKYLEWAKQGLITLTPGYYQDQRLIQAKILELKKLYKIERLLFDPWNATQMAVQLLEKGMKLEECRQGYNTMNEPTKELGVLIGTEQLHHNGNACLDWQAENAVSLHDAYGNLKLDKQHSADKIDGMVCLTMGLAAAMTDRPKPKASVTHL